MHKDGDQREHGLSLSQALQTATRATRSWGPFPDPIAQNILGMGQTAELEKRLAAFGMRTFQLAGAGASSIVFSCGERVVRMGLGEVPPRPAIPEVLQAEAAGAVGFVRYEILPRVETEGIKPKDIVRMMRYLARRGYEFSDAGTDNLGRLNGRLVVIDAGAVRRSYVHAPRPVQRNGGYGL